MNYDEIYKFFQEYLHEKVLDLRITSRLTWKNEVYYCKTNNREYAIKIFKPLDDVEERYRVEEYILKHGEKLFNIKVPKIFYEYKYKQYKILIMEWINGNSIKELVAKEGLTNKNLDLLSNYIKKLEKIWECNHKDSKIEKILTPNIFKERSSLSTLNRRIYNQEREIFGFCLKNTDLLLSELIDIYNMILEEEIPQSKNIINSDISLHEVIIKGREEYWIDFENFMFGDANNDLAGIFYSISNSIYRNENKIEELHNLLFKNKYYNDKLFIFYLIERVLCAYYLDYKNMKEEEVKFYINFINSISL